MERELAMDIAQEHVKQVRDFLYHLMVFLVVNTLLVILDLRATTDQAVFGLDWAYWVILFWGMGLAGHGISVFYGNYKVAKEYERLTGEEPTSLVG